MPELVALQVERALMMARGRMVGAGGGGGGRSVPSLAAFWSVETTVCGDYQGLVSLVNLDKQQDG